jgi:hypothetical protein
MNSDESIAMEVHSETIRAARGESGPAGGTEP